MVDNIIVAGESETCDFLNTCFLEDFQTMGGKLSWYLGFAFEPDWKGGVLRVSQKAFIESIASWDFLNGQQPLLELPYLLPALLLQTLGGKRNRYIIACFDELWVYAMAVNVIYRRRRGSTRLCLNVENEWTDARRTVKHT